MRNEEGNPSPPTLIFPSFAKTEFKSPLRIKPDVNVGFHCCDSIKHPLLRNVLSEYFKKTADFCSKRGKAALSLHSCPQFYSMYTSPPRTVRDCFTKCPFLELGELGGGGVLFLFNPTSNKSGRQWQPQAHTTMFWDFFSITLELSSKYSTEMAWSLVGAQHGFGTLSGFIKCTWKQKQKKKTIV